jgi:2-keto-4-pentenoate hydratase
VLGNPLAALAWLASALGGLAAGQWVLTGAMARAIPVPPGSRLILSGGPDVGPRGTACASF